MVGTECDWPWRQSRVVMLNPNKWHNGGKLILSRKRVVLRILIELKRGARVNGRGNEEIPLERKSD